MKISGRVPAAFLAASLLTVPFLSSVVSAADTALPNLSSITNAKASTTASNAKASSTGSADSKSNSGSQSAQSGSSSQSQSIPSITASTTNSATSQSVPVITGSSSATGGGLTGLPKLSTAISYPPASVPPTQNAPYMQTSSYPEGTVFIAVGGVLGFLAFAVLLWRGMIAWTLHRSVKRAALEQEMADTKALFRTPVAPMYKYSDRGSTLSLANMGGKGGRKSARPMTSHGAPDPQSLFFSPTAGAAGAAKGGNAGNRGSSYLPAGYYAAGASAPGAGGGLGAQHGANRSTEAISLSSLRPQSQGYSRAMNMGPSPPESPSFHPQGYGLTQSTSSFDLNRLPGSRAPSAYLDDLFDGAGAPPNQHPGHGGHI